MSILNKQILKMTDLAQYHFKHLNPSMLQTRFG